MRVKILIHCVGTLVSYMPGEVLDIIGDDAQRLVSAGLAEPYQEPAALAPPPLDIAYSKRRKNVEKR
jgi:hypothetical protein